MNSVKCGINSSRKTVFLFGRALVVAGFLFSISSFAQGLIPTPPPGRLLNIWEFDTNTWRGAFSTLPISYTNIDQVEDWSGTALQVDSTNAAWLQYRIVESNNRTNLTCVRGTVQFWFVPNWSSNDTNQNGTGPGDYGRFIDVGTWTNDASIGWWSLYLNSDGTSITFSSQSEGQGTNYLSAPISWDSATWHLISLTYSITNTALYIDGQLAASGDGVLYVPGAEVMTNGFFVGSDNTGMDQIHGQMDILQTFNYPLDPMDIADDFDYENPNLTLTAGAGGTQTMDSGGMFPGGGGDTGGGTTSNAQNNQPYIPDYGTNLCFMQPTIVSNYLVGIVSNTQPDILYEIQGRADLIQGDWISYGFFNGSELANWSPSSVAASTSGNLFLRIRSWQDTTGTGIPDWWWLKYFGQTTNVDAGVSLAGDGLNNWQKFQMGVNPTNYLNTNAPAFFFGCPDATLTDMVLEWSPLPGPVAYYIIQKSGYDINNNPYTTNIIVGSNATFYVDRNEIADQLPSWAIWPRWMDDEYAIQAVYPDGSTTASNLWYANYAIYTDAFSTNYSFPTVTAYVNSTSNNVALSWTPPPWPPTNYIIERVVYDATTYGYVSTPIAQVGTNVTSYIITNAIQNTNNWGDLYAVSAGYPGGGQTLVFPYNDPFGGASNPCVANISVGSPTTVSGPQVIYGYTDATSTNLYLTWSPASGSVVNYLIFGGVYGYNVAGYRYVLLGMVGGNTASFKVTDIVDTPYDAYRVVAVYSDGSYSQGTVWTSSDGTPAPSGYYAFLNTTGTNVWLSWNPLSGIVSSYVLKRSDNNGGSYSQIAVLGTNVTSFTDTNAIHTGSFSLSSTKYSIQATFPNGGVSATDTAMVSNTPSAPTGFSITLDSTGTNVSLSWTPASGDVTSYTIQRGVLNPSTGTYTYTTIGTVSAGTTTFTVTGAINNYLDEWNSYQVVANHTSGGVTASANTQLSSASINFLPSASLNSRLNISAHMVRNEIGQWQLMFINIPTNAQTILLGWCSYDNLYDFGPQNLANINQAPQTAFQVVKIPVASLTNGVYAIPDWQLFEYFPNNWSGVIGCVQAMDTQGNYGNVSFIEYLRYDSPRWVDGRQHLKQNLLFQLQAATVSQPSVKLEEKAVFINNWLPESGNLPIPADPNYVESSIFHWSVMSKLNTDINPTYVKMDDIWPLTANYELHQSVYDPSYAGMTDFPWQTDTWDILDEGWALIGYYPFEGSLDNVPAPAVLGNSSYWISQSSPSDLPAYTSGDYFHVQSGVNLFGLAYQGIIAHTNNGSSLVLYPGNSTPSTNVNCYFTKTAAPSLSLNGYYFALINTPGTALPVESSPAQPYPLPCLTGFASTNQTGVLITSVGTPTVVGGWEKFSIQNGAAGKFAYLGQYFVTNAYLMTNSIITANKTGVVSPYGEFFPTDPGVVAMTTMPDIDSQAQGTGVVRVISLNVDANHDGTMDFSYQSPDFVSTGKPFRFWANDNQDAGDDWGSGIPGQMAQIADGSCVMGSGLIPEIWPQTFQPTFVSGNIYAVHGRRDLVDFFPVCLNIGSLFQSNTLSAGIDPTDTSYQFVLSQADGVLRFVYTGLTPTNYMNYLRDINVSSNLASATAWPIPPEGIRLNSTFLSDIASSNQNIILVEAATATTQPLVLTIYHGTNQIAQTQLYLSISGVEQMFRSKNLLQQNDSRAMPDRLTDVSVPNEPDTIDKNFIFLHGYNVNPTEARGVFADMFKRLYWSGSHAKFYGVIWNGYDTQSKILPGVTGNLETNVVHAFETAPALNTFLNSLSGTNVVAAHSLGNMVVLSTLNDCTNQNISQYFMLDAAVPMEALAGSTPQSANLVHTDWTGYSTNLWASYWHNIFPTNDARSQLTWNNRLAAGLQNADVYNFYSSGEEVLRAYPNTSTPSFSGLVASTIYSQMAGIWQGNGTPIASYVWNWQELLKGRMPYGVNDILGSDHGGWKFNDASYGTNGILSTSWTHMSPIAAVALPTTELQTNAFFDVTDFIGQIPFDWTQDLNLYGATGSNYAKVFRNRLLSDTIPALTLPVGANPITTPGIVIENYDMMTQLENGWPQGRLNSREHNNNWYHSDYRQVAYTFTYRLFNQFVNTGNLK